MAIPYNMQYILGIEIIRFIRETPLRLADKKVVPADDARIVLVSLRDARITSIYTGARTLFFFKYVH